MFPTALALALALAAGPAAPAQDKTQTPSPVIAPTGPVLALTADEAVQRALENNADLAVEKFTPQASDLSISDARAVYDPVVFSTLSTQSRTAKSTNTISGGAQVETDTITYNFGATKAIQTGGSFRVDFNNNRQKTNSTISAFNPNFNSNFNANFTQPLLKNRSLDTNRLNIRLTKRNKEITDLQFRSIVVSTLANVRKLYFDLIYAVENLSAQRKSLALAQKFLTENQIKVNVGTLAPLDVVAAESEVATREEGVVIAENALAEAQDAIKRAILPKNDPEAW